MEKRHRCRSPALETAFIGLVVCVVIIPPLTWPLVQHFQVMAHEGMHGIIGSLSGHTVEWIELNGAAEGATRIVPVSGPGFLVAAFAGYLWTQRVRARRGQAHPIRGTSSRCSGQSCCCSGLLLIMLKPSFGFITVPLAGFLIFLVLKHLSQTAEIVASYAITWFLLLSGVRIVVQRGANAGDAGILSGRTEHSPASVVRPVAGRTRPPR